MILVGVIFGAFSTVIYAAMTYLLYKIVKNMEEDPETALTKFFLQERATKAFKALAASTLLVSLLLGSKFILEFLDFSNVVADSLATLLPIPYIFLAYFFHTVLQVTEKNQ